MSHTALNGLFVITHCGTTSDGTTEASITVNADHAVFRGHFPGRPILPGVCQMALCLDIASRQLGRTLHLRSARSIKFLAPVEPGRDPELVCRSTIQRQADGALQLRAELSAAGSPVMKMNALCHDGR